MDAGPAVEPSRASTSADDADLLDLAHRSRVLLALSEGLSATVTLADVAGTVESIALDQLGCLHAGMWLRDGEETETVRYVAPPDVTWESAVRNGRLPLDESNPLGLTVLDARPQHFARKQDQNCLYPHLDTSAQVGSARSFTPLVSRGEVLGAMAFLWPGEHLLTDQDRLTIEALSSFTAQAVQRATLLQERLDALVILQSALLPRLPRPDRLDLAARYLPAAARDQVGGDWYDAVVMPSGDTSLMVGDVVGHDLEAAAVMGQLRHMLRAIAWAVDDTPSRNVVRLDEAMVDLDVDGLASLFFARIEQAGPDWSLRWTNAGHPPPVLVDPAGRATLVEAGAADLMLGVDSRTARADNRTMISAGSTLVLYTDGLVERRREDLGIGLDRLLASAERHHGRPVAELLDRVLADLVPDRLDDDVALLGIRFGSPGPVGDS